MREKNLFQQGSPAHSPHGRLGDYNGKSWGVQFEPQTGVSGFRIGVTTLLGKRFLWFLVFVFLVIALFYARIAQLQMVQGASLLSAAEENRIRVRPMKAPRGIIYDRNGEQLVRNVPNLTLLVLPVDFLRVQDVTGEAARLAGILGESQQAVTQELTSMQNGLKENFTAKKKKPLQQSVVFRDHLSYDTTLKLRLAQENLPGFQIEEQTTREYLASQAFSSVLGYTGKISDTEYSDLKDKGYLITDELGKNGLESSYESVLRGVDGKRELEVDAKGKEQRVVASENPVAGTNIFLSIDAEMQRRAQQALDDQVKRSGGQGGALVALDPRTGEIRALVSSPAYDNNIFEQGLKGNAYQQLLDDPMHPLFNRALAGQYPPGSTIKPLIASAALQEHVITETTTVHSTGGIRVGQWFFPDWKAGGHGITDVKKAIAESINTFFYTIGGGTDVFTGLGVERLTRYLSLFNLGKPTGVDLPGERRGFLPSPAWKKDVKHESWYIGDTYHLSIGQGDVLVTPLQMAVATSVIANGGTLYQPHLVSSMGASQADAKAVQPTVLAQHVIDPQYLDIVRQGMRQAVLAGSARAIGSVPADVAGKTGTAQFGPQKKTHAWFTTFAPYQNPHLVIAVIIEGGGEGNVTALPVAKEIYQWYFTEREHVDPVTRE